MSEGDAFERLSAILNELRRDRAQMAPAFLFVDPYGFKIPAGLLGDLMKAGRVELFIRNLHPSSVTCRRSPDVTQMEPASALVRTHRSVPDRGIVSLLNHCVVMNWPSL
jgi:hypothetical protein